MSISVIKVGDMYLKHYIILNDEVLTASLTLMKQDAYEFNSELENDEDERHLVREQLHGQFEQAVGEPWAMTPIDCLEILAYKLPHEALLDIKTRLLEHLATGKDMNDEYCWRLIRNAEKIVKMQGA